MSPAPDEHIDLTVSTVDLDVLATKLGHWLRGKLGADAPPAVTSLAKPENSGMSSTTVLFDAAWTIGGVEHAASYVARLAPDANSFPVFETYDLELQYRIIEQVASLSEVPVPQLCWLETDDSLFGAPFFVMKRVDGRIPSDNPPYVFVGWLLDATPEQRRELADKTIDVLAQLHGIPDAATNFPMLSGAGDALRRHVDAQYAWYRWALKDDGYEIPIIERGFAWLDEHRPADPGTDVLNWGDARPGNIIYDGFTPVAVLDWEMAALGPREMDLGWLIFLHRFFQDIAALVPDMDGLPDFLLPDDVVARYEQATGHQVANLDFFIVYAALRHAIVMARVKRRMIHFGEDTDPADRDDYVMHRASLDALLNGTYPFTRHRG